MGSDGNVSGGGGGAYRLFRSRSLNFFPINNRALSTCCCVPGERSNKVNVYHWSQWKLVRMRSLLTSAHSSPLVKILQKNQVPPQTSSKDVETWWLTFYVTNLELLGIRQGGNVDLCSRVLLQEAHISTLLPNKSPYKMLAQNTGRADNIEYIEQLRQTV